MTTPTPETEPTPVELVADSTSSPQLQLVAIILGATLIITVVAITALAVLERSAPDVLQNVAVGSLAALSALLVGNRR